jgi:hypothetical protein
MKVVVDLLSRDICRKMLSNSQTVEQLFRSRDTLLVMFDLKFESCAFVCSVLGDSKVLRPNVPGLTEYRINVDKQI